MDRIEEGSDQSKCNDEQCFKWEIVASLHFEKITKDI